MSYTHRQTNPELHELLCIPAPIETYDSVIRAAQAAPQHEDTESKDWIVLVDYGTRLIEFCGKYALPQLDNVKTNALTRPIIRNQETRLPTLVGDFRVTDKYGAGNTIEAIHLNRLVMAKPAWSCDESGTKQRVAELTTWITFFEEPPNTKLPPAQ